MKRHLKTTFIITILTIIVLAGFYLQGYLRKRGEQSATNIESSKSISQTQNQQELNKIYQNNKVVGEITGEVKIEDDYIFFEELSETSDLKKNTPFEYQGGKYVITRMENYIKEYINMTSKKKCDILKGVTCKKLK